MSKKFYIEINLKKNLFDAFGNDIKNSITGLGIAGVDNVHVSEIYLLEGDISKNEVEKLAKNLFLDNITQTMKIYSKPVKTHDKTIVEVWYKKEVTDPVSLTALKGIRDIGINKDIYVRCGKKYKIEGKLIDDDIEIICKKLLANTLVQEYFIF